MHAFEIDGDKLSNSMQISLILSSLQSMAHPDSVLAGKIVPPISTTTAGAGQTSFQAFKLGALANADAVPNALFATMDMAELLVYKTALTPEELDRIGSYLAGKYNIDGYILNDDIRSPYRTKAVSRSAGCGSTVRKMHSGIVCKGAATCTLTHKTLLLQANLADATDDYYNLARLHITGGNSRTDGTVVSAAGQTCLITDYVASTCTATCDLTRSYEYGHIIYGTSVSFPNRGGDVTNPFAVTASGTAAETLTTILYVSWVPEDRAANMVGISGDSIVPFVAIFGDAGEPAASADSTDAVTVRELVLVRAMSIEGTFYKLTIDRNVGETLGSLTVTPGNLTIAEAITRPKKGRLYFPKAVVLSASAIGDLWIVTSALFDFVTIPTAVGIKNWYGKIVIPDNAATPEVVQVTQANKIEFLTQTSTASAQTAAALDVITGYPYVFSLLAGDVLRFGDESTGEQITVSADSAPTIGAASALNTWNITAAANFSKTWPDRTRVTLLSRKTIPSPVALKIVRAQENTTAIAIRAVDLSQAVFIDLMYYPQSDTAVGQDWVGGSGVSTYKLEDCDTDAYPFARDAPIQTFTGASFIKTPGSNWGLGDFNADTLTTGSSLWYTAGIADSSTSGATGPAAGGQSVVIKGWELFPWDNKINYVAPVVGVNRYDISRLENYLKVTVGSRPAVCKDPTIRTSPCVAGSSPEAEFELKCQIIETGAGYCANDFNLPCRCLNEVCSDCGGTTNVCNSLPTYQSTVASYIDNSHFWPFSRKPTITCEVPPVLGASSQNLNVYWHGIKTTLTNWYKPGAPVIDSVTPAMANYKGGETVTIHGYNFGPKLTYVEATAGNARTSGTKQSHVEVFGKSFAAKCTATTYVSDKIILCTVPMLPARKVAVDKKTRTVEVGLVVNQEGLRSAQNSKSILTYTSVPTYFACEYRSTSEAAKRDCFTCCRSACIVDEFASGGVKGGSTFSHCDSECYKYCGYTAQ